MRNTLPTRMRRWASTGSGITHTNIHFVMASAQMAGDGPTVIAAAEKLRALIPDEVAKRHRDGASCEGGALLCACTVQHARDDPHPSQIPAARYHTCKAIWHYARGVAFAAKRSPWADAECRGERR